MSENTLRSSTHIFKSVDTSISTNCEVRLGTEYAQAVMVRAHEVSWITFTALKAYN